ncbi:MAG: tetratricopeptide repeat protein, partial [Nitrospira sp.]|nr:tetratricopeptide repeat protein [Nitrospira sp.]
MNTLHAIRLLMLFILLSLAACSDPKEPWDLQTEQGLTFMDQGKFPEAEEALKQALALAEQPEAKPSQLPQSLTNLAILANAKGDPKQAESYLQKTIAIQEQGTTGPSGDLAATLSNLGALHVSQQEYDQALQAFERGLTIRE